MIESFGKQRGSTDLRSTDEIAQERARENIGPDTPVLHVIGSERYHLYRQCPKLKEEEHEGEQEDEPISRLETHALGRLYKQMNDFNRQFQNSLIRLNETGKLEMCTNCEEKRKNPWSKNSDAGI